MNRRHYLIPIILLSGSLLSACGDSGGSLSPDNLTLDMNLPDSMTGGRQVVAANPPAAAVQVLSSVPLAVHAASAGSGVPCAYLGVDNEDDIFRNGYETTRFMVSAVATWTCIADMLIDVADTVPHNGVIFETENDNNSSNYKPDDPTHYSVTDDSPTQTTVRLYYNYSRSAPPISGEPSQFYISWNKAGNGDIDGRLIIDALNVNPVDRKPDDPVNARMDFRFTAATETADMFLQFDDNNIWADGFRIEVTKDLTASPLQKVFVARGKIDMKAQFIPVGSISEIPEVQLYAVADGFGNGASIAEFRDLSLPLPLNIFTGNHLGNYLFTRTDIYFFQDDMDWDYIHKTVTSSEYRGGRTTPASGGTWLPFNPSLDIIVSGLALDPAYFTGNQCAVEGNDCNDLLNAINNFVDNFAGAERNQGNDPMDWRSDALAEADYLTTVYPNGIDWTDAFTQDFTPSP
jgi:hypothetical protein